MVNNFKNKYLKYKLKYLLLKGGNITLNKENFTDLQKKYIETQKKNLKKLKKYEKKFLRGIKIKDFVSLCNDILKIGKSYDFDLLQQIEFIKDYNNKNQPIKLNNANIHIIILHNLINYYLLNVLGNNSDSDKIKYLTNNSQLKLDNKKINNYNLKHKLGEGDFGITYDVGNKMVLKTIDISTFKINHIEDKYFNLQNIVDEINIMIKLNNSNISPNLIDTWMYYNSNKTLYICILMEYKGIALSTWEKTNKLTKDDNQKLENKVSKLHDYGIIHKDLHKSNILVEEIDNNRDFYIADFGLSKTFKQIIEDFKVADYKRYSIDNIHIESKYLIEILSLLNIKFIKM
jgi:tRNA A-37 threonylcarbamoyl transferase component Bud32